MSLPVPGTAWPPVRWSPVTKMIGDAAVWWEGDPGQLDSAYAGGARTRPSQYMGGLVGATSRFFWGTPTPAGKNHRKVHLPMAADIAATSANLLFETPPTFATGEDKPDERLDLMFNNDTFPADLLVMGESLSALGGSFGRVMWDTDISDTPWIDFVDADSAFPEFSYGRLTAITFHEELPSLDDKHVWRLFSRYSKGRIEYGLYMGESTNVGTVQPLPSHPATEALAKLVDADSSVDSHTTGIAAAYAPNVKPVVGFRKDGQLRNIGRPDLSPDLFGLFDLLDEIWSDIRKEMKLGKGRAVVPEGWLNQHKMGGGQSFDVDREFFEGMRTPPDGMAGAQFFQPSLRFDKYLQLADATVLEILRRANFSPATFGITTGGVAKTATEINSEYRSSMQTWKQKSRYVRAALSSLATSALEVDAWLNKHAAPTEPVKVTMAAPVQETLLEKAQTVQALDSARAISTEQKIDMLHVEWSEEEKRDEVTRIKAEQAGTVDPFTGVPSDHEFDVDEAPAAGSKYTPDELAKLSNVIGQARRAGVTDESIKTMTGLNDLEFIAGVRPITMKYEDEE